MTSSSGYKTCADATNSCAWATRRSCRTSKRPFTWSNSMMRARSKSSPTSTTKSSKKCNGTSSPRRGTRRTKSRKSRKLPRRGTWSTGRTNLQAFTPNKLRPSSRSASRNRSPRGICNVSRRKRSSWWKKSISITPKAWRPRKNIWRLWVCLSRRWLRLWVAQDQTILHTSPKIERASPSINQLLRSTITPP